MLCPLNLLGNNIYPSNKRYVVAFFSLKKQHKNNTTTPNKINFLNKKNKIEKLKSLKIMHDQCKEILQNYSIIIFDIIKL